jgi:hypothetical protein
MVGGYRRLQLYGGERHIKRRPTTGEAAEVARVERHGRGSATGADLALEVDVGRVSRPGRR